MNLSKHFICERMFEVWTFHLNVALWGRATRRTDGGETVENPWFLHVLIWEDKIFFKSHAMLKSCMLVLARDTLKIKTATPLVTCQPARALACENILSLWMLFLSFFVHLTLYLWEFKQIMSSSSAQASRSVLFTSLFIYLLVRGRMIFQGFD